MKVSVIISTYNWPAALTAVLRSLESQTVAPYEVIVADDGSGPDTKEALAQFPTAIHVWHEDDGFRLAEIRNKALMRATGDWVVFLDGDCICPPYFVAQQMRLADSSRVVAGNRRLLDPKQSTPWLNGSQSFEQFIKTDGFQKLKPWPGLFYRDLSPKKWQKVRGCNIGIGREAALKLCGFDESYQGWGKEDSDFAVRAVNMGLKIRLGQHAVTVLHLYHREADRGNLASNQSRLDEVLASDRFTPVSSQISC